MNMCMRGSTHQHFVIEGFRTFENLLSRNCKATTRDIPTVHFEEIIVIKCTYVNL